MSHQSTVETRRKKIPKRNGLFLIFTAFSQYQWLISLQLGYFISLQFIWKSNGKKTFYCESFFPCGNGSFLHALSWRSVWKNCPSVIWKFSCVSRLKNGSQGSFWGRGRRPRPRNDPRLPFFNRDTQENFQITQGHFFQTLRQVQWVKERAFSNFLVFSYDHSDHWVASFCF